MGIESESLGGGGFEWVCMKSWYVEQAHLVIFLEVAECRADVEIIFSFTFYCFIVLCCRAEKKR